MFFKKGFVHLRRRITYKAPERVAKLLPPPQGLGYCQGERGSRIILFLGGTYPKGPF